MRSLRAFVAVMAGAVLLSACTAPAPTPPPVTPTAPPTVAGPPGAHTALPAAATVVVPGTGAAELAEATSRALYTSAPAVVLLAAGDDASTDRAVEVAVHLGVPLLLTPAAPAVDPGLRTELDRLGPATLVAVGDRASAWASTPPTTPTTGPTTAAPPAGPTPAVLSVSAESADDSSLPALVPPVALSDLLVLARTGPDSAAAVATARAAGARTLLVDDPDPRVSDTVITALAGQPVAHVLAVGSAFGPAERLRQRVDTAATGVRLPGGGQVVFPARRMVALYGHPGAAVLGVLGEQGVAAAVARARTVAATYSAVSKVQVIPAFEIIATVAAASAGSDGNYSNESSPASLRPWVDAAKANGIYVVLDLQPGRSDFLSQAKLYADLLAEPNVGLALDPEWRMAPNEVPMQVIGSVSAAEINRTGAWLDELTRSHHLPQKVFMLHQFRLDMISDRSTVDTSYDELQVLIHADGFGNPGQKMSTWNGLHLHPPADIWWGWKNFYDEDTPTFTPKQTMAVSPAPVFVSYQ